MDYLQYIKFSSDKLDMIRVLNLIINGLPSIFSCSKEEVTKNKVLNLIINGLPSI